MLAFLLHSVIFNSQVVKSQAVLGGGAPPKGDATGSVVTTTTYLNAPTAAEPPLDNGPWTDVDHLEGTWSSKSMMVMTGPDFYDPVDELLIEPALPGLSFSFTKDGFFEQAAYQVSGDGKNNSCSTGALTFQHGTYKIEDSGQLTLTPFSDDGRQLVSEPCKNNQSEYVFYEQALVMKQFKVWIDLYYGRYRLDLEESDGTPFAPLYLVYRPPQMLPTVTMNPGTKAQVDKTNNEKREVTSSVRERIKRSLVNRSKTSAVRSDPKSSLYNSIWWGGVGLMTVGAAGWIYLQ